MHKGQAEMLNASSFKDGSLLEDLARGHVTAFKDMLPETHKPVHARRTWGSLCSGSEGAHYVVRAAEAAIGQWNAALGQEPLHLDQLFACENVPMKRKWIDHVVNGPRRAKGHKEICIFINILHVG